MTEPSDPFKGLRDPFVPETVRVHLPDGTDVIDLGATAMNHIEAPLPRVGSSNLQEGDVLTVEFDKDYQETFEVASLQTGSLVFGSDDVRLPEVTMKRRTENEDEQSEVKLYGSAISPSGMMRTPGTIRVGSFMVTDLGVSTGTIRTFDLKRPDENGDLQPVMLNKKEIKQESDSFSHAKQTFEALSELLKQDGFTFEQEDDDGSSGRYSKVNGDLLVYAARQGFGCAVVPQDEIYIYDAKAQVLRGMRNIPTQGIMQALVVNGVSKDVFQKAGIGYRDGNTPDWRHSWLESSAIHRMSEDVPVISYTWLSQAQEAPVITVLEDGKNVSKLFRTPKQKGAAFVENMKAHGGEDLIDNISQMLDIDPNDSDHIYDNLEVDIYPGEEPKPHEGSDYLWASQELAAAFGRKVKEVTSISYKKDSTELTVDGHSIRVITDIGQEIDKMAKAAKLVMGTTQKAIGSRLLNRLRPKR